MLHLLLTFVWFYKNILDGSVIWAVGQKKGLFGNNFRTKYSIAFLKVFSMHSLWKLFDEISGKYVHSGKYF